MAQPANEAARAEVSVTPKPSPDKGIFAGAKYKRVKFDLKSNPTDPNDVVLAVQGFQVKCQRGVETIVPDFILEAADHAIITKYTVQPGQGRKVGDRIRKFPYTVLGDATESDFRALFMAGSKKTREAVAQYGLKIPVEKSQPQDVE